MMGELRNPDETPEHRLKRLRLRSWRRGIKEMDLILGAYSDARLAELDAGTLDRYEALLDENDQDLYKWVSGGAPRLREAAGDAINIVNRYESHPKSITTQPSMTAQDRTLAHYHHLMQINAASHLIRAARHLGVLGVLREGQKSLSFSFFVLQANRT